MISGQLSALNNSQKMLAKLLGKKKTGRIFHEVLV